MLFKLGSAESIISLGLKGIGMFTGGGGRSTTQYYPDTSAMYEADLMAYSSAIDTMNLQTELLSSQVGTQMGFDKYNFDLQNITINNEMENALESVQAQYQTSLYNSALERMTLEAEKYAQTAQYNTAMLNEDASNFYAKQQTNIGRMQSDAEYNLSNISSNITRNNIGVEGTKARADYELAGRQLNRDLSAVTDASTGISYKQQGIDLQRMYQKQKDTEAYQNLDSQEANLNTSTSLSRAGSERTRGDKLTELLKRFSQNEREFEQYNALLGATGQRRGSQLGQANFDQFVNERVAGDRRSMMGQYALGLNSADINQTLGQGQIDLGRRNVGQNSRLAEQGFRNEEGQLDLSRSANTRDRLSVLDNQLANRINYESGESSRELQLLGLNAQDQYDLITKSLLPELSYMGQDMSTDWNTVNNKYLLDVTNNVTQSQLGQSLDANRTTMDYNYGEMYNSLYDLVDDFELQKQSNIASYLANQGNTNLVESAGLNQIGASTYGLLSQLGNYQNSPNY